ncbi:MAG: MFS transporter [Proteobacteria bacterium]|nr:MFS transporter [Pseudomonadota bacterium]
MKLSSNAPEHSRSIYAGRFSRHTAFVAATCAFVFVFAAAGTPIPLYNIYRLEDGLTNSDLAIVSVAYFIAAASSLLIGGRLSNFVGRRPVALVALLSAALGCLILSTVHNVTPMLIGRVLQGLACGITSSSLGAYVVDTAESKPRWLTAAITGSAPMLGIPVGALTSGALVEWGPEPRLLAYGLIALILLCLAVVIALSPETVAGRPGSLTSLRPHMQIPRGSGQRVVAAGAAAVATWSLGGFYQAFGPSVTAEHLGTSSPLVTAAIFSSVMGLNPLGGPLSARFSPVFSVRLGMGLFIVAVTSIMFNLWAGWVLPFIGTSLVVGIAQGLASTGAIRALLDSAGIEERAGLLASLYFISYSGAAIPGMVAGRLASHFDLFQIALGYSLLGIFAALVAMATIKNPTAKPPVS